MKRLPKALTAAALAAGFGISFMQPAKADQTSTEEILAAGALIAGIAISENIAHKQQLAQTVVGRTANGGVVFGDGHVVLPNGQSFYPGNFGDAVSCNGG